MTNFTKIFRDDLKCYVEENSNLKKYNTFKIGGNCPLMVFPDTINKFKESISYCNKNSIKYIILGNGSNILFDDNGYDGIIISTKKLNNISFDNEFVYCESGAVLALIGVQAAKKSLTGFEKLSGIPGTIGGAVVMNAGAYGSELKDVLVEVTVLDKNANIITLSPSELDLGYRSSNVKENNYIVLSVKLKLEEGNYEDIKCLMDTLREKRKTSQPLEYPNAGSIFKRNGEFIPGKAIDEIGLKGFSIGGASVSEKHANFIVNKNNASSKDIKSLISYIQKTIKEKYNEVLHTEIEIL